MRTITKNTPIDLPKGIIGCVPQWSRYELKVDSIINPQNELEIIHDHLEAIRHASDIKKESALAMHSFLAFRTGRIINLDEDLLIEQLTAAALQMEDTSADLIIEDAQRRAEEYNLQNNQEELNCRKMTVKQAKSKHTLVLTRQLYASFHLTACAYPINKEHIENEFFETGRASGLSEMVARLAINKALKDYADRCKTAKLIRNQQERAKQLGYTVNVCL